MFYSEYELLRDIPKDQEIRVEKHTRNVLNRLQRTIARIIKDFKAIFQEINQIYASVQLLSDILSDHEATAGAGIKRMDLLCIELENRRDLLSCGELEQHFLSQVIDYVKTKGEQLFNYRHIIDAPATNNYEEAQYHSLKLHLVQRSTRHLLMENWS